MEGHATENCDVALNIMQPLVEYSIDGRSGRIRHAKVPEERCSIFLRALALHSLSAERDEYVSYDELKSLLSVYNTNDVYSTKRTVSKMLECERHPDRPELIRNVSRRGYYLDVDHLDLDISRVGDVVKVWEETHMAWFSQIGDAPSERQLNRARAKRTEMGNVLALWRANPAEQLRDVDDSVRHTHYRDLHKYFNRAYDDACRTHAIATILTCDFLTRIESSPTTHEDFSQVTTALDRMESVHSRSGIDDALRVMLSCLGREDSSAARYLVTARGLRDGSNDTAIDIAEEYFKSHMSRQVNSRGWSEDLGIAPVKDMDQNISKGHHRLRPIQCMKMTESTLYVAGVLTRKWVVDRHAREELERLCMRLDTTRSEDSTLGIRFLVVNPLSDGFRRFKELPNMETPDPWPTVEILKQLDGQYTSFEARAFDSVPIFRIIIIDTKVVTFSPYKLSAEQLDRSTGSLLAPHFWLRTTDVEWPLSDSFMTLFDETWRSSRPIAEINNPDR